jgi:hypothetical protein
VSKGISGRCLPSSPREIFEAVCDKTMSKTTQFKRTPAGTKTDRMLQVEAQLGRTLEEDYKEYYFAKGWGQKRLANRWGVARGLIFGVLRGGRRNWVQMLDLPVKAPMAVSVRRAVSKACEICGVQNTVLEGAHWIAARDGGSTRADNILRLCPNCHKRLDLMEDAVTVRRACEVLLLRAAEAFLQSGSDRGEEAQRAFLALCARIIERH